MLQAYIGVLILAGVYRSKNETTIELFDDINGRPVFRAIRSKKTFEYLNRVICFDDVISRRQQRSIDKFAPIRDIFDKWSNLLSDYYNPYECMPSKPVKYGIKFWLLVCSYTCYVWKIQPYLGKAMGASSSEKRQVVLDLVDGLKRHNITMDNFFSTYELGQKLLSKGITMVGSIPPKLLECENRPLYESTFAFTENTALVSYIGRKNKFTVLQSTLHNSIEFESTEKKLLAIIAYYNKTKNGVDTVDKMLTCYSCNRWPMAVFANMIDISFAKQLMEARSAKPRSASSALLLATVLEESSPSSPLEDEMKIKTCMHY